GTYIYGVDEARNIQVPISRFKADAKVEEVDYKIGTEQKVYYQHIYRETSKDGVMIKFGKGFTLKFDESMTKFDINYSEEGSIRKLKEILYAFNAMGIEPKEDFDKLKKYSNQINLLADITRGQVPEKIVNKHKQFLKLNIGEYNILCVKGTKKEYKTIFNIFDYEKLKENYRIVVSADKSLEGAVEHSPYVGIKPDELFEFNNVNLNSIEK